MIETYPRLFGKEKKVVHTKRAMDDLIKAYNGKKTCWVSLYSFSQTTARGVVPESAVIDCISLICLNREALGALKKLFDLPMKVWDSPFGHLWVIIPYDNTTEGPLARIAEGMAKAIEANGIPSILMVSDPTYMVPYPGTIFTKNGKEVKWEDY